MSEKRLYTYNGPVMEFNNCIAERWQARTYATSEAKARNNLAYQFKMQMGKEPRSKISITGKLMMI